MKLEQQIGEVLKRRQLTLCTAESCTGGLIASCITDVAGSSAYMLGGVVAYANEIKQQLLHVRIETLRAYGAVSEQTAIEMAQGALSLFHADYALSVTGIAGPGGGTPEKPVGLTYIGLAGRDGTLQVERYVWQGDRQANKQQSVQAALNLLLRVLQAPQN
ncbi:MAG: CinA family protein [Chloroflexi bacterium]|nr:MAG: CinA family protein [Chloroflexota bacterium]